MPVPDFQSLMLPVLRAAAEGEITTKDLRDRVASEIGLSESDLAEMNPSERQTTFVNRTALGYMHLQRAGLLEKVGRGVYRITDEGRKLLEERPERIDLRLLERYPSYVERRHRSAAGGAIADGVEAIIDKLQASVDATGTQVGHFYITFILFGLYLTYTVAATTDEQLLLSAPVALPLLNVRIPLSIFYYTAPILFVMLHFNMLLQLYLLAQQLWELDLVIPPTREFAPDPHRQLLHVFPFNHMLIGRHHRPHIRICFVLMIWTTMIFLPILLLLFIQARFLPYHDASTTTLHRRLLLLDVFIIGTIWSVIVWGRKAREANRRHRKHRYIPANNRVTQQLQNTWRLLRRWASVAIIVAASAALLVSWFILTFPGDSDPRFGDGMDGWLPTWQTWVFRNVPWLHRNRIVPETDLVLVRPTDEQIDRVGQITAWRMFGKTASLQNRDLRYANLHRSILTHANLTQAVLDGADLRDADLELAMFDHAQMEGALLNDANLKGATFFGTNLDGANLDDATLRGAVFYSGSLRGASLKRADLEGAVLRCARLQGADFTYTDLAAASLWRANVQAASFGYTDLTAADLRKVKGWQAEWPEAQQCVVEIDGINLAPPAREEIEEIGKTANTLAMVKSAAEREDELVNSPEEDAKKWDALTNRMESALARADGKQHARLDTGNMLEVCRPSSGIQRLALEEAVGEKVADVACVGENGKKPEPALVEAIARRIVDEPSRRTPYRFEVAVRLRSSDCPAAATLEDWYGRRLDAIVRSEREEKAWAVDSCPPVRTR
jgi:uncharacterized protein YjbI with pentapeptide repeats